MPRWIETEGTVRALTLVRAPLSGRSCVLYQVNLSLLQRLKEGLVGGGSQLVVGAPFSLTSAGQMIIIDPRVATLTACPRRRRRVRLGREPAADLRLKALYERLFRPSIPGVISGLERQIQDGDRVCVAGWLEQRIDPRGHPSGYRTPPTTPVLRAQWVGPTSPPI